MDDRKILDLFWERSPEALESAQQEYGRRLRRFAENLLGSVQDAEECMNDVWMAAWNTIPPRRPDPLLPYLYKIVRNLCLKKLRSDRAVKRGGGSFLTAFSELDETLGTTAREPSEELEARELTELLNRFLQGLSRRDRALFLGRYWYGEPYDSLAARLGMTKSGAAARMSRLRDRLKRYLTEKEAI